MSASIWLKDALFERTTLVETRLKTVDARGCRFRLVVVLQVLDIVIVLKVLFSALCGEFLGDGRMVGDVNIFQLSLEHLLLSVGQELLNLIFHGITLFHVTSA